MNFNSIAWAAVCFYYRSVGDEKYGRIMADAAFLKRLRELPDTVDVKEFEEKVILDHVRIDNYDLLVHRGLAGQVLGRIVDLQSPLSSLIKVDIRECDLDDEATAAGINEVYTSLSSVRGLWETGVSKIMHVLNDRLFAMLSPDIAASLGLVENEARLLEWLKFVQQTARGVSNDFRQGGFSGSPEAFLSEKLGYSGAGYQKSIVKFLDEYFWLRHGDGLPIPPKWIPSPPADRQPAKPAALLDF
jgi:hypothetical protein